MEESVGHRVCGEKVQGKTDPPHLVIPSQLLEGSLSIAQEGTKLGLPPVDPSRAAPLKTQGTGGKAQLPILSLYLWLYSAASWEEFWMAMGTPGRHTQNGEGRGTRER